VFRHFKDKRALFTAFAADGFRQLAVAVAEQRAETGGPPARQLSAIARAYLSFALEHPGLFRVMFRGDQLDLMDPDLLAGRRMLEAALRRRQVEIGAKESDISMLVHAATHGLALLTLETDLAEDLPDDRAGQVAALMAILRRLTPLLD
jgi:AcrR family transcriptional regulator